MESRKLSILLPSAYRAQQLRRAVELIREKTPLPFEILVSVVEDDRMSQAAILGMPMLRHIRTVDEYERGAVYAWNKLAKLATGDVLALWADDLLPGSGWAEAALGAL